MNVFCKDLDCISIQQPPPLPPLVGACVDGVTTEYGCYRGKDVCVWFSLQVPQCVDVPCWDGSCIATHDPLPGQPLVGVCVDGKTTQYGCYGGHDVCIGFSYQIPFCVDYIVIS
jgi:hypothetical protein